MLKSFKQKILFAKRKLISPAYPEGCKDRTYIHIGCGKKNYPGFINVDVQPYPHVHVISNDIANLDMFQYQSADLIYMSHILEHFKINEITKVLREMFRILKQGGTLRVSVPDFDKLIEAYHASGGDTLSICKQLLGGQDSIYNVHYTVFNQSSLVRMLNEAGFSKTQPWDPWNCAEFAVKDSSMKILNVNGKEIKISLNIDAVK